MSALDLCPSCGCTPVACPIDQRDACAIVNGLPTHGEVMALPGHLEAERREHPSEPPGRGMPDETCVACDHPRSQHEASAWADRKCRAGAEDDYCDCHGFVADVAPPLPAGEGGSAEGWESPAGMATRVCAFTPYEFPRLTVEERDANEHGARAGIRARDATWLTVLCRILDEPDLRRLLLAHVERVSR